MERGRVVQYSTVEQWNRGTVELYNTVEQRNSGREVLFHSSLYYTVPLGHYSTVPAFHQPSFTVPLCPVLLFDSTTLPLCHCSTVLPGHCLPCPIHPYGKKMAAVHFTTIPCEPNTANKPTKSHIFCTNLSLC